MTAAAGWAAERPDDALSVFQESLPVELIATPRAAFVTCHPDEPIEEVVERNRAERFDHLPVVERGAGGEIVGVLETVRLDGPPGPGLVRDHLRPLGEELLIGGDASILEFLRDADRRPFRFVVSRDRIGGLVSLSDLQQIAVRAALFAMVTHLELSMAAAIRHLFADHGWKEELPKKRRENVEEKVRSAREEENLVDELLYTDFGDKRRIVARCWRFSGGVPEAQRFAREALEVEKLRNRLAHASDYAATRDEAARVCEGVRRMGRWIDTFSRLD